MAAICNVCPEENNSTPSAWCPDCDDLLCQTCTIHHTRSSASKGHQVIPYEDYQKLPPFILKIKPYCSEHNERFTDFCRTHDAPICITCLRRYHRKCEDVPKIDDIVHKIKDSVLFEDTMLQIETNNRTLKQIAKERNENLKQLTIKHEEMKVGFKNKIDSLVQHLNIFKDNTLSDMDTLYDELFNDISDTFKTVQSMEKELSSIMEQKEEILKYASNYQTLIGIKEMETILYEVDINLNELSYDGKLMNYNIEINVNDIIEDILSGLQTIGDIKVTNSPSAVPLQYTEARYLKAVKVLNTQVPVQLQLQQTIDLESGFNFKGCCTLPSGLKLFAGFDKDVANAKVVIHKSDGSLRSTIKLNRSEMMWDMTPVDNHHVAVSHPRSGAISIIDVDSNQVVKNIRVRKNVRGLCCRGRDIVCCVLAEGLFRVNIDSEEVKCVKSGFVTLDSHIHVSKSLICYTYVDSVTALDTQYNFLFRYEDESVLRCPSSVTIDEHEIIYVTGCSSHNLLAISPDGTICHQLLGKESELRSPILVHYDIIAKELMVVNEEGPAFLYSLR